MSRKPSLIGTVYLIHFEKKFYHSKHYIGFTERPIDERMKDHESGQGAKILAALVKAGIGFKLVRTWENQTRSFERKLKKRKNSRQLCPCDDCGTRKIKLGKNHKQVAEEWRKNNV